jgi:hypothetical protein
VKSLAILQAPDPSRCFLVDPLPAVQLKENSPDPEDDYKGSEDLVDDSRFNSVLCNCGYFGVRQLQIYKAQTVQITKGLD